MTDFFDITPAEQVQRLEQAGRDALSHWNIEDASLELIKHRENAVFRVGAQCHTCSIRGAFYWLLS